MAKSSTTTRKTPAQAPAAATPAAKAPTARAPTAKAPTAQAPTAKAPTAQAPAAKTPAAKAPAPQAQAETAPSLKKRDLFERVKARSDGVKGKDVRVVMDAMLEELGAMLVEGKGLNARPLGTLKVQRHNTQPGADVVVCKLRRKKPGVAKKEPLAGAAE